MSYKCSSCGEPVDHLPTSHQFASAAPDSLYFCGEQSTDAAAEFITAVDSRLPRELLFMQTAELFAQRSTCTRAQVGCVLVKDNRIVSTGYNGSPPGTAHCIDVGCLPGADSGCIRTTHAEVNAIFFAARAGVRTDGCELYCTHEPCLNCAKAIVTAGIKAIYYKTAYRLHDGIQLLTQLEIPIFRMELAS